MRYCGRDFTVEEVALIRTLLQTPRVNRAQLSRALCERLNWRRANGGLKDMSCRVALLRMQADGHITLPPPRNPKPVAYRSHPHIEQAILEPESSPDIDLATWSVDLVRNKAVARAPYTAQRYAPRDPVFWYQCELLVCR